jgi:hypothetical protein
VSHARTWQQGCSNWAARWAAFLRAPGKADARIGAGAGHPWKYVAEKGAFSIFNNYNCKSNAYLFILAPGATRSMAIV